MFSAAEGPLVDGHVGERERREGQTEAAGLRREARRRVWIVVRWSGRLVGRRVVVVPRRPVRVLRRAGGPLHS